MISLKELQKQLSKENNQLRQQLAKQVKGQNKMKQQIETMAKDLRGHQTDTSLCPVELPRAYRPHKPVEFSMTNFEQHKRGFDHWLLPPFYTRCKGYKMRLMVFAGGCGEGANVQRYISAFFMLVRGEYDEQLKWPFQGKFSLQLLSQSGDKRHHKVPITFDASTPDHCRSRVLDQPDGEPGSNRWGKTKFIPHSELTPKYLQNDCLMFCVKKDE